MPDLDLNVVVAAIFGLFVLYFIVKMLAAPARMLVRVLMTGVVGACALFIFNLFAGLLSVNVGINAVTAMIVGYMGIPGLAMLVALQMLLR